ncbi:MAG: fimbrial assembly protein FimA, partial [Anaerolineae bacterium]|nr:fimbrial assembly protein FimA [Anaerolineae bacterium]
RELQAILRAGGYRQTEADGVWDEASIHAFWALVGNENLEERWHIERDPNSIDRVALEYLRERFAAK